MKTASFLALYFLLAFAALLSAAAFGLIAAVALVLLIVGGSGIWIVSRAFAVAWAAFVLAWSRIRPD